VTSCSGIAVYSVVITSYTMLANECGCVGKIKGNTELIDLASDDEDDTAAAGGAPPPAPYQSFIGAQP